MLSPQDQTKAKEFITLLRGLHADFTSLSNKVHKEVGDKLTTEEKLTITKITGLLTIAPILLEMVIDGNLNKLKSSPLKDLM